MAAYFLIILATIWFAFITPFKVVAMTFTVLFLVALTIKALTVRVSGQQVGYSTALKAVALSIFLFLLSGFFMGGLFSTKSSGFTFLVASASLPILVPVILLLAFILGFHLCLPTSFKGSSIVSVAATAVSVAIFYLLRPVLL